MRLLVIGGSGYLGTILMPYLRKEDTIRVMDVTEPKAECDDFIKGSVLDAAVMKQAMSSMEGLIYFAMARYGCENHAAESFDVNVKGVHLALEAARQAGITRAVYTSTLSIYKSYTAHYLTSEEDCPGDTPHIYGFTKWLGELVCQTFGENYGMTVTTLRLCFPMPMEKWQEDVRKTGYTLNTAAPDVADAVLRAVRRKGPGYVALFTTGDWGERQMSQKRALELLGWAPKARPRPQPTLA
jgi:nucleoside-diphosphate-sugar epimerase